MVTPDLITSYVERFLVEVFGTFFNINSPVKGTVSREVRGYKSGINGKASLNPGASEANNFFFVKVPV